MGRSGVYGAAAMALPSKRGIRAGISGAASKSGCCRFFAYEGNVIGRDLPNAGLRRDYVEGSSTSPTGYLEGIFVLTGYRGRGLAKALLAECEKWSRQKGCREMGSDCALETGKAGSFICTAVFWKQGALSVLSRIWRTEDGSKTGVPSIATGL